MKKTIIAAVVACSAAFSFAQPVAAETLILKVKPVVPVVKKVVIRKPCYYKTTKTITNGKTVIKKRRICP